MDSLFASLPRIDSHVHFVHPERADDLLGLMDAQDCARFNLVCIPNLDGSTHNSLAISLKKQVPQRAFISGALNYLPVLADPQRGPDLLASQVSELKQAGFDGLKLIEGKPEVRKILPYPLDGPLYAKFWAALEQEALPVVFHVNDPPEFWHPDLCPDWARQAGWDYSNGQYPSREQLYTEVEHILERHPQLKIILAHFYFLSAELDRAARFLDSHPQVCFDLAPHMDMYKDFSRSPAEARHFFIRFQDRILYGTDTDTRTLVRDPQGLSFLQSIPLLIRSMLEQPHTFTLTAGLPYHGLGLPHEVLQKIYTLNFERIYGTQPVPLQVAS